MECHVYSEYMDDINNSEGFYITPGKDGSEIPGGIKVVKEHSDDRFRKAEVAAKYAVAEHNKKEGENGRLLNFKRIVNLNVEPAAGAIYYITIEATDNTDETLHFQVKVWEKINTGFLVLIFRLAAYWVTISERLKSNSGCIWMNNLSPWMDSAYLYYKCFYRIRTKLLGVKVYRDKKSGKSICALWFKNGAEAEEILKNYVGKKMTSSTNLYSFELKASDGFQSVTDDNYAI